MPSSRGDYYIPVATSPSIAQSPFLSHSPHPDTSTTTFDPPPPPRSCLAGSPFSTRWTSLLSRRAVLVGGLLSLLTFAVVSSSILRHEQLSLRAVEIVDQGHKVVDAVWDRAAEAAGVELEGSSAAREGAAVPFAGQDMIASQADTGLAQTFDHAGDVAGLDALDHPLLTDSSTGSSAGCPPDVLARVNQAASWTVRQEELQRYSVALVEDSKPLPPPSCLAHAVFSARLVSVAAATETGAVDVLDAPESQTLVALDRPKWQPESSSYALAIPDLPTLPSHRYKLEIRLEFGYYPGLDEGIPCGPLASECRPERIVEAEGLGDLRYLGDEVAIATGATLELPLRDAATTSDETAPICTDLSSLNGFWSNLSYHPASPACSLAIPTLPLPAALFRGTASFPSLSLNSSAVTPLWINVVGDSNSRNTYKRLIDSLGGGFHTSGPVVMDSKTHNGTLAGLAFRYRDGVPPADETKQVPDVVVTWMWWYQMAPPPSEDELESVTLLNRDELLSYVDTDLAAYLSVAKLDSACGHFPPLVNSARGVRPYRTYLSLGSHGEELSVPGMATSLDVLLSETDGLSRSKRDAAHLRLVTTTLVNARYIPLARFPHQDLVRTNALIHAKNAYAAHDRPEFAREGRVLDVEALTSGIVEQDEWMKPRGKRGPDAVHFRTEVYDEWVRVLWTDLLTGAGAPIGSSQVAPTFAARERWKRRLPRQLAEDDDDEDSAV
ncbi:hypothetical protein JCM3774_001760 [Rhodotorula dairenensis]